MSEEEKQSGRCMVEACCCSYTALDCKTIEMGLKAEEDCLCVRHGCCLSLNAKSLGCGVTTDKDDDDECCKLGAICCDLGLIKPKSCCSGAGALCCLYQVYSFPCKDNYVDSCVCACCFLTCAPKCGCCVAPPECPALAKLCTVEEVTPMTMEDRGEDKPVEAEAVVVEKKDETEEA